MKNTVKNKKINSSQMFGDIVFKNESTVNKKI